MAGYKLKDETDLAWLDNRDQVKLDVRKVVRRLENALLDELAREFTAAINRGEILELRPGEAQIAALLKKQADRLSIEAGNAES
jgi:hypothetical protein